MCTTDLAAMGEPGMQPMAPYYTNTRVCLSTVSSHAGLRAALGTHSLAVCTEELF